MGFFTRSTPADDANPLETALELLQTRAIALQQALEPESPQIGYIAAGMIGSKVKGVRQALDGTTVTIETIAKDNNDILTSEQVNRIHTFIKDDMLDVIEDILHRCSEVHHDRFKSLGVASIVEKGLGWFVTSFDALNNAFEARIKDQEQLAKVKETDERILKACENALKSHREKIEASS